MRNLREAQGLPGIAPSDYGSEEDLRHFREAGFAAHFVKPVDVHELRHHKGANSKETLAQ